MRVLINGKAVDTEARTVAELLDALGHAQRRVAVELNAEIVPRGRHVDQPILDGDRIELVQAMGGG